MTLRGDRQLSFRHRELAVSQPVSSEMAMDPLEAPEAILQGTDL